MRALHMTAMGRVNTPEQRELCEKLEQLFATPEQRAETEMEAAGIPKRGPGRPKKAE